jgi:sarcosine oxidase
MATFDVIVIGLGGMGSAAAAHLAARGARVLGLEQFQPAHARGSSHGHSRMIRLAYFEHPSYVPLLLRAYESWARLEHDTGRSVLTITGGLMIGEPASEVVSGSLRSAREHGLAHEVLDAAEIRRRVPAFTPAPGTVALYEPRAGVLQPETAILAHLDVAANHGARLQFDEPVTRWRPRGAGVEVRTARGVYGAPALVIAPGAWAPQLLGLAPTAFEIERQVLYWFSPAEAHAAFAASRFPVYLWDTGGGVQFYGFPTEADGRVKVAFFRTRTSVRCTPDTIARDVTGGEIDAMRAELAARVPALAKAAFANAATCMYTLTPDRHFVLGVHPEHPQVTIASPCSGHGYKFASVIGEILADLAIDGTTRHAIGLFDPARLAAPDRSPA